MKKKLLALVLCAVTATSLLLAGCGGNDSEGESDAPSTTSEPKTEEQSTEPEETEPAEEGYAENSLIAYYSFDDSDDLTKDSSDNGLALTNSGATYAENGKVNGAAYLDGNGSGFGLSADVFQESGFTFACWVNLDEDLPFARVLNAGGTVKYYFLITSNNNDDYGEYGTAFKFRDGDNNIWYPANQSDDEATNKAAAHVTLGEWTHLAFTFADGTAKLYFNGELVAEYTGINYTMADFASEGTYLGKSAFDTDPSLKGYIDEVYFYNYALDADAIAELMN